MAVLQQIKINKGKAFPLGISKVGENEIQIAIWHPGASACQLRLYYDGKMQKKISMSSLKEMGMEDVFSIRLQGENLLQEIEQMEYDFVIHGEAVLDPYVREISGRDKFGKKRSKERGRFIFHEFDWSEENWEKISVKDMILYQCHVRGFTKHNSSGVKAPGTFSGMQEKIPYLKELGVNTLLLLPIYDFNECLMEQDGTTISKINYWGYGKEAYYFAPKSGYASVGSSATEELKSLIKCLHQNGMNLILDMYFDGKSPRFIVQCLQYYALEFHVDGFRLNPGCIEESWIQNDPVLSHLKILGVSWGDQEETFGQEKFVEMNDGFLIDARRYLKSDEGQTENFYRRFREQRKGVGQVHYVTHNNGFTLRDLISYDVKHNEANGEKNLDGTEYNYSWNCGVEGPTRRQTVLKMRRKQERNAFVMLLLGMATPMLLSGYYELTLWDIEETITKRIEIIEAQNQLIEQEKIQEEKEKKAKEKRRIIKSYIILGVILLIAASFIINWLSGYSHNKVDISVVSKNNDTFNENLADGHYQAGYFYIFGFEIENNSQHDIKMIGGTMEIFNSNGESLAVSNMELQGKLKSNSTEHWDMRLQVDKSDAARELWDSDLSELKITFRIKKIRFEDGTYKNYSNTQNEIIYPEK